MFYSLISNLYRWVLLLLHSNAHTLKLYSFSTIAIVCMKFILLRVTLAQYPHGLHTDCTLHALG